MVHGGAVLFWAIAIWAEAVQPLAGSVTVTVYVPPTLTVGISREEVNPPGPLQLNVAPAVVELAISCTEVIVQVSIPQGAIVTFGAVVFEVTVAEAEPVQPLAGSVTMTV